MSSRKRHQIDTSLQTFANKYHEFLFFNNGMLTANTDFPSAMENRIRDGIQNGKVGQIITGRSRIICSKQIFMCERVYSYASFTAICDIFTKVYILDLLRRNDETGMFLMLPFFWYILSKFTRYGKVRSRVIHREK